MNDRQVLARRILGLVDLTSLNPGDDEASTERLAIAAVSTYGNVAAVCVWPRLVPCARAALETRGVRLPIAAVTNFPAGTGTISQAVRETADAIAAGADEIDLVFPYRAFLDGDRTLGIDLVRACRAVCGHRVLLKVILETGQLRDRAIIEDAARAAIEGGAHFLKTSTGKTSPAATPQAAAALLSVLAGFPTIGLKLSGGIQTLDAAIGYVTLVEQAWGPDAINPTRLRIGASALLQDLIATLG